MFKEFMNKKVLVRSCDAGVYFGVLVEVSEDGTTAKLEKVRNIWSWEGASCLSQVANDGIKDGHISPTVSSMVITGVCQYLPLTDKAISNLESFTPWEF